MISSSLPLPSLTCEGVVDQNAIRRTGMAE